MQITLRAVAGAPSLRATTTFTAVCRAVSRAHKPTFRVIHFSAQHDHMHLIVEAPSRRTLRLGVQGLAIRIALAVNRAVGRRGPLWGDRYHARALRSPREVRNSMVYVLLNFRKHLRAPAGVDPCSSGPWFLEWKEPVATTATKAAAPVATPATWLARVGWTRIGARLSTSERPAVPTPHAAG